MEKYFEDRISFDYSKLTNNDIVISASLFTFKGAYNKISLYVRGLSVAIKRFKQYNKKIKFVIFYDVEIDALNDLASRYDGVYLCKFNFPEFKLCEDQDDCDNSSHIGVFGVFMRYLPMFLTKFKYSYLYIIDCDIWNEDTMRFVMNILKTFIKTKASLHILTLPSAPCNSRYYGLNVDLKTWVRINGWGLILHKMKFPVSIIYNFLHSFINSDEYKLHYDTIFEKVGSYQRKLSTENGKFMYGSDEVMLLFVMKYIEDKKIPFRYSLINAFNILCFYYWLDYEATEESKLKLKNALGGKDITEFIKIYGSENRKQMFKELFSLIDIHEHFSPMICDAFEREYKYHGTHLYSKLYKY